MRFPSINVGSVEIPLVRQEPRFIPVKDDLAIVENLLLQLHKEIQRLEEQKLYYSLEDRENMRKEIVVAKIALIEAEIKQQFLKEEQNEGLTHIEASNEAYVSGTKQVA